MSGAFTTIEVGDPHKIASVLWDRLPSSEKSWLNERELRTRNWEAADWGRFRSEPQSYRSTVWLGHSGNLRLSSIADQRGVGFAVRDLSDLNEPWYVICVVERGASRVTLPTRSPVDAGPAAGQIFLLKEATRFVTADNSLRQQLWVPSGLVRRSLEAMVERPVRDAPEFAPGLDWARGSGASIRRLVRHIFGELSDPASLLSTGIGAHEFEQLVVQSMLRGLQHSHSNMLQRLKAMAAPGNVRRAEEFLRANAQEAVGLEQIANAAGCSIRALQLAFRRFRNTTPMEALRRARLEQAHNEILKSDGSPSVISVAAKYGFANPGRFANQYKRAFGEYPSQALRARSAHL